MKKITARIENYTGQDGQIKGKFLDIGAIGVSQAGKEYILLNPNVNLAGVLFQQNLMAHAENKPPNKNIMCNIFESTYNQSTQPQQQQQAPQQQNNQQNNGQQGDDSGGFVDDSEIPF